MNSVQKASGARPDFYKLKTRLVKKGIWPLARFIILFGICFLLVYPLLFMFTSAFRSREDMWNPSVVWITRHFTLEHIKTLIEVIHYPEALKNTLLISVGSAVLQTLVASLVGYGFARFRFKGREVLFLLVIFTIIVPPQAIINTLYMTFRFFHIPVVSLFAGTFNLLDTPLVFWIQCLFGMGLRGGLFIFIFRQFYRGMPSDLENAALIDGCNPLQTYMRVMLPNAVMVMVTVFMFSLVWHWNDVYSASILTPNNRTLSVAISDLRIVVYRLQDGGDNDPIINQVRVQAGALLSILPMLILFLFTQKTFTESIERTGLVG